MNRSRSAALAATALSLVFCAPALAAFPHTVMPGETLTSIAAANGMSTASIAAANGISPFTRVIIGSTVLIPPGTGAGAATGTSAGAGVGVGAPEPLGAHTVLPGETLSGIAARSGVSMQQLAWMNGLAPGETLLSGTALKLPTGAPGSRAAVTQPVQAVPQAPPYASPGRTSSSQIGSIAAANGVPASLASAIAWQESGFNNAMVSSANARGVMQVMPGTFQWVQQNLAAGQLNPASTDDNVRAGVLYLGQLLRDTGGSPEAAAAAYYQGLASVRAQGMLPETQRYVANVMALRARFGG